MASSARKEVIIYEDDGRHASTLPLVFDARDVVNYRRQMVFGTRGAGIYTQRMATVQQLSPTTGTQRTTPALSLALVPGNALWARWRYASLSNTTLNLSTRPPPMLDAATPTARLRLACSPTGLGGGGGGNDVFCVSTVRTRFASPNQHAPPGPPPRLYSIVLDPHRERAQLPADLYVALTQHVAVNRSCLVLEGEEGTTARICPEQLSYFSPVVGAGTTTTTTARHHETQQQQRIVLGANFLRSNTVRIDIDGWTGTVDLVLGDTDSDLQTAMGWALAVLVLVLSILYGRWGTGMHTPALSLVLHARLGRQHRHHPPNHWHLDAPAVIGSALVIVGAALALVFTWLMRPTLIASTTAVVGHIDFVSLHIIMTVYIGVLLFWHIATLLAFDLPMYDEQHGRGDSNDAAAFDITVTTELAWARHALLATLILGSLWLSLLPFAALNGGLVGNRFVLFIFVITGCVLLFSNTYFAIGGVVAAASFESARLRFKVFVAGLTLWMVGLAVVLAWFVIGPVVDVASSLFDPHYNFVAAVGFVAASLIAAALLIAHETRVAVTHAAACAKVVQRPVALRLMASLRGDHRL